jgi:hypothetical protein
MKMARSLFILILVLTTFSAQSFANGIEYYTDRPQILKLKPDSAGNVDWINSLNWAQTDFIAQLLGLYPTDHLYFLARDGEYIYDLAVVLTEKYPELKKRIHLINVSRLNWGKPKLHQYLIQNGVTDQRIVNEGVVFVDTGFAGSVGKAIKKLYPDDIQDYMKIHLIESSVGDIPASKIFKIHNAMTASNYEMMARYFDRSHDFVEVKGKLVPISPITKPVEPYQNDGTVDKKAALSFMRSTLAFGQAPHVKSYFQNRLKQWRYLSELALNRKFALTDAVSTIQKIRATWTHEAAAAMVSDFIQYYNMDSGRYFNLMNAMFDNSQVQIHTAAEAAILNPAEFAKKSTAQDLRDLAYILGLAHKQNQTKQLAKIFEYLSEKKIETVLNASLRYMEKTDQRTVFKDLIQVMPDDQHKKWSQLYKTLDIHSGTAKERLTAMKSNSGIENSCQKVVGY